MLLGNYGEFGGRQVHQDDLRILQDELLKAIQLQYVGQGAFILQGCAVTGGAGNYTIGDGLVFVNGLVMQFSAVSGIASFPRYIVQAADVLQDSFPLEQGGSAYKRTLVKAELASLVPGSSEFIVMSASGGRNYNDILASQFVRLSGNQTVNGQKNFTSDLISNGVNINSEINNLNGTLVGKANKSVMVTGGDGLTGGGDLTVNRIIALLNGGVTNAKLADGSVSSSKLSADLVKVKNPAFNNGISFTNPQVSISEAELPGCKIGFWVSVNMPNNYPNTGVVSYRLNGVGINGQNVLRQLQGHYHTGSGASLSTSTSFEFSWFCPLPQGCTGIFSMGHYVGSGASAEFTIRAYM